MRHNNAGRRLGRKTSHRIAMFRNMVTSLLNHERITTTDAKAKELRSVAEKIITLGKRGDLHSLRQASAYVRDKQVVTKLFTTIGPRYKDRSGGYTRIIKLGARPGDNAPVSIIELVEEQLPAAKTKTAAPKKRATASKAATSTAPAVSAQAEPAVEPAAAQAEEVAVETSVTEVAEEGCVAKAD
jgi:large subunit ribosomal protein L17